MKLGDIMRILVVAVAFAPSFAFGGAPKVAYDLAKELAKRNHDVVVYTSDAKDAYSRLSDAPLRFIDGVEVHYFRNLTLASVRAAKQFITPNLIETVQRCVQSFDVIHLHEYRSFQNIVVHHYAKKYGVPYLLQAHGSLMLDQTKRNMKRVFDGFFGYRLLRDASTLLALSKTEQWEYHQMAPHISVEVLPNGVDLSCYEVLPPKGAFRVRYGIPADKRVILFLGRLHWKKGVDQLVNAYAYLTKNLHFHESTLCIVGPDDGFLKTLQTQVKFLNLQDSIHFAGPLYGEDKLAALNDADVCVLPSRYEAFPMSALEAYACGKPVIASKILGLQELVQAAGGCLYESENVRELAELLLGLLLDEEKANTLGLMGKHYVKEHFSLQVVVDDLLRIYTEAMHS